MENVIPAEDITRGLGQDQTRTDMAGLRPRMTLMCGAIG